VTLRALLPGTLAVGVNQRLRGVIPVRSHTYQITFTGQADRTLCAQFDDCEVTTGPDTTTLRADLSDQAALCGLVQRIAGLGLEIINVQIVTPQSAP
jgi:hypothetical protein